MNSSSANAPQPQPSWRDAVDNPWVVLALLFLVMAILGLPVLWMSKAFSVPMKILLSLIVTLYTAALFGCVGVVLWWAYQVAAG